MDPLLHKTIKKRYVVEKGPLGATGEADAGGWSDVYLARDRDMRDRRVILKFPKHELLEGKDGQRFRARFEREIQALIDSGEDCPGVVPIWDVGEHRGRPFCALQFLAGGSLESRLTRRETSPDGRETKRFAVLQTPAEVAAWLPAIATALDTVHRLGIVHRDVKPANILFSEKGTPYLSDFGIARLLDAKGPGTGGLTETAMRTALYTAGYEAPEFIAGVRADFAYDHYALAVVVFRALTGRLPHWPSDARVEDKHKAMAARRLTHDAESVRTLQPQLSEGVAAVVAKALSRRAADRYANCSTFAEAFRAALRLAPRDDDGPPAVPERTEVPFEGVDGASAGTASDARDRRDAGGGRDAAATGIASVAPIDTALTIDVPGRARSGRSKVVALLVVLAVASLGFLAYSSRPRPSAPVGRSSPEKVGAWVDKLRSAGAIDERTSAQWLAQLAKLPPDAKAAENVVRDIERVVRGRVIDAFAAAEGALGAWDGSFAVVGRRTEAVEGLKAAWERAWEGVQRQLPRDGVEQAVDGTLLGDALVARLSTLEREAGALRVRVFGPDPATWIATSELLLEGEVDGARPETTLQVNGEKPVPLHDGAFSERVAVPGDGGFTVTLVARDGEGATQRKATRPVAYNVDRTPPVVVIESKAPQPYLEVKQFRIVGRVVSRTPVTLTGPGGVGVPVDERGYFSYLAEFTTEGARTFTFAATDVAGNRSAPVALPITYRPVWSEPLARAKKAFARKDLPATAEALEAANARNVPNSEVPSDLRTAVDRWNAPPTLAISSPAEGQEIEADEVEVQGTVWTGRGTERVFVGEVEMTPAWDKDGNGTFRAVVRRGASGPFVIAASVRDGNVLRAQFARTITFVDRSPGQALRESADNLAGSSAQQRLAKDAGIPIAFENGWGMQFRLLDVPLGEGGKPGTTAIYLQATEMTVALYGVVHTGYAAVGDPQQPIAKVSKDDLADFFPRTRPTRKSEAIWVTYRLPKTEEWDKAAAIPTTPGFWSTPESEALARAANFAEVPPSAPPPGQPLGQPVLPGAAQPGAAQPVAPPARGWRAPGFTDGFTGIAPVRKFAPNAMGFYDLLGNVWEWTYTLKVGPGANTPSGYFIRGGSWKSGLDVAEKGFTDARPSSASAEDLGFRLVAEVDVLTLRRNGPRPAAAQGR